MRQLRRFPRHSGTDRGAVVVEAALITPLICLLVFGLIEFGFAWKDKLTLASATRQGARVGSALGNQEGADAEILAAIEGSVASLSDIRSIVVYQANGPGGKVPEECTHGSGVSGTCNVYTRSGDGFSGDDSAWPATDRETRLGAPGGPDYLGVWIDSEYSSIAGIVGDRLLSDEVVMRLEPSDYGDDGS